MIILDNVESKALCIFFVIEERKIISKLTSQWGHLSGLLNAVNVPNLRRSVSINDR